MVRKGRFGLESFSNFYIKVLLVFWFRFFFWVFGGFSIVYIVEFSFVVLYFISS